MNNQTFVLSEITGFKELQQKLISLSDDKDKRREMLMILRQAAKPALDAAKTKVPVSKKAHWARKKKLQSGNLKKSLGIITGKSKVNPTVYVGARAKGQNNGWYAHFVHERVNIYNKGYKRKHKKGANSGAAIGVRWKSNPFLRNAYNETQGRITADAEAKFAKFLQNRIDKLSR